MRTITRLKWKRTAAALCIFTVLFTAFALGRANLPGTETANQAEAGQRADTAAVKRPKYIFLFVGDGMSYPQIECTNYWINSEKNGSGMGSAKKNTAVTVENELCFLDFPVTGSARTYSSSSYCTDSAAAATAMATGNKTYSGRINVDKTGKVRYKTIAEQLKEQLGYKIGIVTSANLNHATPAAFYAHRKDRSDYYEIGLELIDSGFDYFGGGSLRKPTGKNKKKTDLYKLARKEGYTVATTREEAEDVTGKNGKVIVVDGDGADSGSLDYEIDRDRGEWALADYVEKGIECLAEDNDRGFFMLVEGGKIDWACHANDAATAVTEVKAFSDAVEPAAEFYKSHPDETLIIVTGDHETSGMMVGSVTTGYDTFLENLSEQKISFQEYDDRYVERYRKKKTGFQRVLKDIRKLFGLVTEAEAGEKAASGVVTDSDDSHPPGVLNGSLVLTDYELQQIKDAWEMTVSSKKKKELSQQEYELYGSYEPLTVTVTHILNQKSGVSFAAYSHSGLPAAVFAQGQGAEAFTGYYDNTDIYKKLAALTGVK